MTGEAAPGEDVTLTIACTPPDVTGADADSAQSHLEMEGFEATFDPELGEADPATCTVEDQDPIDDTEPGSEVILTPVCEVPDVTAQDAESAQADLEAAGLTVTVDPEPDDPVECTVADQDPIGDAEPGADVMLTLECPGSEGY